MPWKDKTVEDLRKEFAEAAENSRNFSAICREYGITRATGYKWLNRYKNEESLSDRSRRPNVIANKTPEETERKIIDYRKNHEKHGAKKIKAVLEKQGIEMPSVKTVNNILNRNGCITKEESEKHKPFCRFEKEHCNEMWQTDFKGEFRMQDNNYCFPLDVLDDHSRFSIAVEPLSSTGNTVLPIFRKLFDEYGMPEAVLSDNGAQFARFRHGYTQFEKWLMNHDVLPVHGRIKHPQTQGKIERFHRTMKDELLRSYTPKNIEDAKIVLAEWREQYNNERPHEALGMHCPAEVYEKSKKFYRDTVTPYEYGGQYHVIKVNSWGYVRFDKWQVYLSETMINEYIEFRPSMSGNSFLACYRNFAIAEFDAETGELIHRSINRISPAPFSE